MNLVTTAPIVELSPTGFAQIAESSPGPLTVSLPQAVGEIPRASKPRSILEPPTSFAELLLAQSQLLEPVALPNVLSTTSKPTTHEAQPTSATIQINTNIPTGVIPILPDENQTLAEESRIPKSEPQTVASLSGTGRWNQPVSFESVAAAPVRPCGEPACKLTIDLPSNEPATNGNKETSHVSVGELTDAVPPSLATSPIQTRTQTVELFSPVEPHTLKERVEPHDPLVSERPPVEQPDGLCGSTNSETFRFEKEQPLTESTPRFNGPAEFDSHGSAKPVRKSGEQPNDSALRILPNTEPQPIRIDKLAAVDSVPHVLATESTSHGIRPEQPIEVHLKLDPPELGEVRVHLRLTDHGLSVRIVTATESASKLLDDHLTDLRQAFSDHGLSLGSCHVSSHAGSQHHDFERFTPAPIRSRDQRLTRAVSRQLRPCDSGTVATHGPRLNFFA